MNWRLLFPRSMGARSLEQLKEAAGSPFPYRISVATFWWLGGVMFTLFPAAYSLPPAAAPVLIGMFVTGGYFFVRIFRRGLAEVIVLYLVKPKVGFFILGWLLFGNPLREGTLGRAIFVLSVAGLVFSQAAFFLTFRCCPTT